MSKQYLIPSKYIVGKLPKDQLNLNDLPEYPVIPKKSGKPEYIGFINFFKEEEGYGFIVTNGQGMDKASAKDRLCEVFFHIHDWEGEKNFSEGDIVKFALTSNKGERKKAISISLFDVSIEAYAIGKKYIDTYSHVIGKVKREYISKDFQKSIHDIYLASDEGKSIVLKSLVNDMKVDKDNTTSILNSYFSKDSRIKNLIKEAENILTTDEDLQLLRSIHEAQFSNAL